MQVAKEEEEEREYKNKYKEVGLAVRGGYDVLGETFVSGVTVREAKRESECGNRYPRPILALRIQPLDPQPHPRVSSPARKGAVGI